MAHQNKLLVDLSEYRARIKRSSPHVESAINEIVSAIAELNISIANLANEEAATKALKFVVQSLQNQIEYLESLQDAIGVE